MPKFKVMLMLGAEPGADHYVKNDEGIKVFPEIGLAPKYQCDKWVTDNSDPLDNPEAQLAWAEFQVMAAIHNLRECKRDHYLVVLVEAALADALDRGEAEETKPKISLLQNQAD